MANLNPNHPLVIEQQEQEPEGNVVWPIPKDGIRYVDALETVFEISYAKLGATDYEVNGNDHADDLYIDLTSEDCEYKFHRAKLIDLLEEMEDGDDYDLRECFHDDGSPLWTEQEALGRRRTNRLLIRLILAYREWKATDAIYSLDELQSNPIPKLEDGE